MSAPAAEVSSDERQRLVRAAWAEVLGHEKFTDADDFFAIGGTSLRAMKVGRALGRSLGMRIPVRMIMENRTVQTLSDVLGNKGLQVGATERR